MRARYEEILGPKLEELRAQGELAPDADGVAGVMTATICFFYLFNIQQVFGVPKLFGASDQAAIGTISGLLRDGMRPR